MKILISQSSVKSVIIRSLISIALGVCLIIWSDVALKTIVMLVGGVFFITGLMAVIRSQKQADANQLTPINGIGSLLLGLVLLLAPWFLVEVMVILLGIALLFAGAMQLIALLSVAKRIPISTFSYIMPIILLILGLLIIFQPWNIATVVVLLLGISIVFYGVSDLVSLLTIRNITKNQSHTPQKHDGGDIQDVEYEEVK